MPFLAPVFAAAAPFVTNLLIGTALSFGATLLQQALAPKPEAQRQPGVTINTQIGGTSPLAFQVGLTATGGHRVYAGTWGQDGETPNAFYTDVLEISNVPIDGLNGIYVNKERSEILTAEEHPEYGSPIAYGRRDGQDYLWVKFYDGRQTAPDAYLRNRFGGLTERPYDADMVGQGTAYAIVTVRYNRELWKSGAPQMLFEVRGIRCYDIRLDSTAGGSGTHRRNDPSTWEWSDNPYVIAYNVAFMGVYYGSEWVWGLQNLPALRLPLSAWVSAMNEADRMLPAWDNQRQFTVGGEISVDSEPVALLEELANSSLGRFIESAGSYKPRCGAPGTSVYAFGEADLLVTDPRTITPFPGLESTHNTVEASYVEPAEAWGSKAAPVQSSATFIAADGNRRLAAGLRFPMVSRNEQAQRLSYSFLQDGRRFRQFQASFHPITWLLEPGDVIDGTILSEGYNGKQFEILHMSGRRTFVQTITLREIDPNDFDVPISERQDWSVGPIQTLYPPSQPATGITFAPYTFFDNAANARRPGIEGFYQGAQDDVQYFRVQVRKPGETEPFFDERYDYRVDVVGEASQPFFSQAFTPNLNVLVRGKYVPYSSRETDWSIETALSIPDIKLNSLDVEIDEIRDEVLESVAELDEWTRFNTREEIERQRKAILLAVQGQVDDYTDRKLIRQSVVATSDSNRAEWTQDIFVATGPDSAIVSRIEELRAEVFDPVTGLPATTEAVNLLSAEVRDPGTGLEAVGNAILSLVSSVPGSSAEGLFRIYTQAAPSGALARIALSVSATTVGAPSSAAIYLDALAGGTSQVILVADRVSVVTDPTGTKRGLLVVDGDNVFIDNARVRNLTAVNIDVASLTATTGFFDNFEATWAQIDNAVVNNFVAASANIGDLTVSRLKILDGAVTDFPQSTGPGTSPLTQTVTYSGEIFAAPPGPFIVAASISSAAADPGVYTSYFGVRDQVTGVLTTVISAGRILNFAGILGGLVSGRNYRFEIQATFNPSGGGNNAWSHSDWYMTATIPRK